MPSRLTVSFYDLYDDYYESFTPFQSGCTIIEVIG